MTTGPPDDMQNYSAWFADQIAADKIDPADVRQLTEYAWAENEPDTPTIIEGK